MTSTPDKPTVDLGRMAECGEYLAVVVVNPDGTESCWLLAENEDGPHGCNCAKCVPHEQLGRPVFPNRKATS